MAAVTVFCKQESPRFRYVLNWILRDVLHISYDLTDEESELRELPFFISYGTSFDNALSIPDTGLLWETGIHLQDTSVGEWKTIPSLFHSSDAKNTFSFDLFSAVFYLLTRYEEYYKHTPDKHGRYPSSESILSKNGWLKRPLVDEWIYQLYHILKEKNIPVQLLPFQYKPTYDIDMAYSYKHKGLRRNIGGFIKDFLKGDFKAMAERRDVLLSKKLDPFDAFVWMMQLHSSTQMKPVYFILAALKTTAHDKNIHPGNEAMQKLVNRLSKEGKIGLHPSYYSVNDDVFEREKIALEHLMGDKVIHSRQHYIKLTLPSTYRHLIKRHIQHDFSMGYGNVLGFRAGTGRSFLWYDVEEEKQTTLRVHPFCFMDSTALFECRLSAEDAFAQLHEMKTHLQKASSMMITVFHNFSLGSMEQWEGWKEGYEVFVNEISTKNQATHLSSALS